VPPWSLLTHSPARGALPMAHRVALVIATTLWLAGYSMPSLVTRRRRRVTYFAFPFGGRANGRVYRQCRQRPQRPREPCTVRLRRRQCYAHSRCQQRVRKRAAAARRTLAGCVCAAGCRPPHARLTPASCVCGRRLPPRSRRHCLRGRACGAKASRSCGLVAVSCVCVSRGSYFAGLPAGARCGPNCNAL